MEGEAPPMEASPQAQQRLAGAPDEQSKARLAELHAIEKSIVRLLESAGKALKELARDEVDAAAFTLNADEYYGTLASLRTNLRQHIGAAGRTDLTFQASTYLEEKQFELLGAAASLAEAELSDLIDALPDAAIEPHGSAASQHAPADEQT